MVAAGGYSLQAPGGGAMVPCRAHVRHVVTDDRMVRRGQGRVLMGRVRADAGAESVEEMACLATVTAVPFYGALGFVLRGARVITLAPGITFAVVEMRRGPGDLRQG